MTLRFSEVFKIISIHADRSIGKPPPFVVSFSLFYAERAKNEPPSFWTARFFCWRNAFYFCATQLNRLCLFLRLWLCNSSRVGADTAFFIHSGFSWFFVPLFYFRFGSICLYFLSAHWLRRCAMNTVCLCGRFAQTFQQCRYMPLSLFLRSGGGLFAALRMSAPTLFFILPMQFC